MWTLHPTERFYTSCRSVTSPRCLRDTGGDPGNGAGERVAPKCYHNIMELGLNLASGDSLYINWKKKKKKKAVKTSDVVDCNCSPVNTVSTVRCRWYERISEGIVRHVLSSPSPPPEEPEGTALPAEAPDVSCYGERGPFVRHQISPVPKADRDRVSSAGVRGGETQAQCPGSGFCLHERAPWIPPTRAGRGRAGDVGRREAPRDRPPGVLSVPLRVKVLPERETHHI
ncbi:hypothetical protein F2P81_024269 [Scophthalmus maximus]|uniref:Uncharacterized protein n=1 Tax=Scophthalmus maximus TaxID=52904 RepID=A0A6A4RTK5_SCOMX|nr:hypothetical protein F2P81_024269 [Scophthalmus maximus]